MKYMGSKRRIAKYILPIILEGRKDNQWYVEPFCGGCNSIDKVTGNRLANDSNIYLIELFKALQNGWIPPSEVTEAFYKHVRANKEEFPPALVGFIGFACSFGGSFFHSFARNKSSRNYADEGKRNLLKQLPNITDVVFTCGSYRDMSIPANSIIYCDPPYADVSGYKGAGYFNKKDFLEWCVIKVLEGHTVFVSEYSIYHPNFKLVFEKELTCNIDNKNRRISTKIERLYKVEL
jgi:DNA adenine methylase